MKRVRSIESTPTASVAGAGEDPLYARIHALVLAARQTVARGVDLVQVRTNFEIGRHVVEHEQQGRPRADYGRDVLKKLAQRLTAEFGGGFSLTNLKLMRQFYLQNAARMGQTVSDRFSAFQLRWSHCVFLLGIKNGDERSFYEIESSQQGWTLREMKRQFDSGLYERLTLSRDKEGVGQLTQHVQIVALAAERRVTFALRRGLVK